MDNTTLFGLFFGLITKHFIIDFLLQTKYQWSNKGTLGHPGGLLHAGLHIMGTLFVGYWMVPNLMVILTPIAVAEGILHYFIDYGKMNFNELMEWKPDTSKYFWWLLGLDQWAHHCCYLIIIILLSLH